jgi:hypothetical protein
MLVALCWSPPACPRNRERYTRTVLFAIASEGLVSAWLSQTQKSQWVPAGRCRTVHIPVVQATVLQSA